MERDAALAEFNAAREEFFGAFERVPDEALGFLKLGEDYSLGGLVPHVSWVLTHYTRVLEGIAASGFSETRTADPPEEIENVAVQTRRGLVAATRAAALEAVVQRHDSVIQLVRAFPPHEFEREAPVYFGDAPDPYPTSPAAVVGWLRDHYAEHVPHVAELLADYRASA